MASRLPRMARSVAGSGAAAARNAVEDKLFGALAILRLILLANAVALNLVRAQNFERPRLGLLIVLIMIGWTAVVTFGYAQASRRTAWLLLVDLALGVGLLALSLPAKGPELRATVPGFWVMAAMLAWAIHWGWRGGFLAAIALVVTDFAIRDQFTQANYGNSFLLFIGGPIIGFLSDSLKQMAEDRDHAQREAAAAAERARLARAVHDGVLQVLALVQRSGRDQPGDWGRLASLAGEQEVALRALIRRQDSGPVERGIDLVGRLEEVVGRHPGRVHLSVPAGAIELPEGLADQLVAAVAEALANVVRHAGPGAGAWLLVEAGDREVAVSVRDDGPGIAPGRLAEAEAAGRLGISSSIRGRMEECGGTAVLTTSSEGTEWELTIPRGRTR